MDQEVLPVADAVANKLDADVVLYNGKLRRPADKNLISECIRRRRRENVLFILVTEGGDADAAYRIARCLQNKYKRLALYVSGYCKSAGTLVAVGAHDLIMSDHGELGPLDVQMPKEDDIWEMQSGLTVMGTLNSLERIASKTFGTFLRMLLQADPGSITLRTAAEIATKMTSGLYAPLYNQVDPLHVGEVGRAMAVASEYGERLLEKGGNITRECLRKVISDYKSHGFVIDRTEADQLFANVREPNDEEIALAEALGDKARLPVLPVDARRPFLFLSSELDSDGDEQTNEVDDETEPEQDSSPQHE